MTIDVDELAREPLCTHGERVPHRPPSGFRGFFFETEFGFRTAREIEAPVKCLAELRKAVSSVMPMFELAGPASAVRA